MDYNPQLLRELNILRQRIKEQGRLQSGRAPIVCSDDALCEIARLMPQKESDLIAISGLGKTFIDQYGNAFLKIVSKYTAPSVKGMQMNVSTANTLRELEKKLVSINRRNRLLYMPRIVNKYAFDLFDTPVRYSLNDIIIGKAMNSVICDVSEPAQSRGQGGADKYRKLVQLLREVNKDIRDKGQNDLFIGYPFIQGRLAGENFDIKAPLALFPVVLERDAQYMKIRLDDTRDTIYNNTLILAHQKFNNMTQPLPNPVIEDVSPDSLISEILSFYNKSGININDDSVGLTAFKEYRSGEFPAYQTGELYLCKNIVLGKFPTYSSSIQKDFDGILDKNEINALVNDLLIGAEDIDYYSDSFAGEEEIRIADKPLEISEQQIRYINELNSAQETVLAAAEKLDKLVVQGPPGTGKSQTITSLISEFVTKGKTVLMVSEKKTALDVVYSRLGNLSQYALMIDDVGNKDLFYHQLERMLKLGGTTSPAIDINPVSLSIDDNVLRLENIAQKLYAANDFGIEPYKLYLMNNRIDLSDAVILEQYKAIRAKIPESLLSVKYPEIKAITDEFRNEELLSNLDIYHSYIESYPWLNDIKENLSEYEAIIFNEKLDSLINDISEWKRKNWLIRLFGKGRVLKTAGTVVSEYYINRKKETPKHLFDNAEAVRNSLVYYAGYLERKPTFYRLSDNERAYFTTIRKLRSINGKDLMSCSDVLFNYIIFEQIQRFETANRDLLSNLASFDGIIKSLSMAIAQKRELTRNLLEEMLSDSMKNITYSKRFGDISRVVESKRKWSVNKFTQKFDFELFKSVRIWLLTPEVVSEIIPLQVGLFDIVIFDEASQMYVEKGIPSIIRAKKVVIAGDHKQLRPSNLGAGRIEIDEELIEEDAEITVALEEESLLDLARFKYQDVLLNFHYRSQYEELIAFSNYAFYKGRLYVSPNVTKPAKPPIEFIRVNDALWVNRSNYQEAREVISLLKQFFENRTGAETIGIITFNSSQRDLIDDLIDEESVKNPSFASAVKAEISRKENGEDIGLFVKNIESVQGDERDVIIFSIGYAKNENGRLVRNYGWLNQKGGENRLNVAISRARKKVYIVSSFDPSELQVEDAKNDGPRILKKYLQYAQAISNSDNETAKQLLLSFGDAENNDANISFDSDFENQVYDELVELGYTVETQVGIGGYSIDLAIKRDSKYILGIECDGKLYHSSKSARERDYHRQKYLESRGWRIHRIWSTNWWKNPRTEIQKISTLVDSL
jgi:very-short-patch-repair endonuclease